MTRVRRRNYSKLTRNIKAYSSDTGPDICSLLFRLCSLAQAGRDRNDFYLKYQEGYRSQEPRYLEVEA